MAVESEVVSRQQRTAGVGDIPAGKLNIIPGNDATVVHGDIFRREIQLRYHYRLTVDGGGFPPQHAVLKGRYLICRQCHPKFQSQRLLSACSAIHQITHLVKVRTNAVDVSTSRLIQHGVTNIAGIERRITEETVVIFRVEFETIEHIGRSQELVLIGIRNIGFTRRFARFDTQHCIQITKQAGIELTKTIQFRVNVDQIRAFRIVGDDEIPVLSGRQRISAGIHRFALIYPGGIHALLAWVNQAIELTETGVTFLRGRNRVERSV